MQWAKFYKNIYEMHPKDKPVDDLIENDFELDRWFDNYIREAQRAAGGKANTLGLNSVKDSLPEWKPGD